MESNIMITRKHFYKPLASIVLFFFPLLAYSATSTENNFLEENKVAPINCPCPGACCPDKIEFPDPALNDIDVKDAIKTLRDYQALKF